MILVGSEAAVPIKPRAKRMARSETRFWLEERLTLKRRRPRRRARIALTD